MDYCLGGDHSRTDKNPVHCVPPPIPSVIDCSFEITSSNAVMMQEAEPLTHQNNSDSSLSGETCKPFPLEGAMIEF